LGDVLADHARTTFAVPVPEKVCDALFAELAKERLPVAGPGDPVSGANATPYCTLCPARIVKGTDGKPVTANKVPVGVTILTVTFVPTAVSVPVWDALVVPSKTEPKFRLLGVAAKPLAEPFNVAEDGLFEALLSKLKDPETFPAVDGVKVIENPTL